jgi:stearoyl-CoA desaturase (Delta-9 desaturase)
VSGLAAAVRDDIEPVANERRDRIITGIVTAVPILSLFFVGWQLWASLLGWNDIFVFLVLYLLTGLGVTVGFHRLFTHRAFKTRRSIRAVLAILGSAAIEGPVISWVADHRKHHAFSDRDGDPHSPHVDHGRGGAGRRADWCTRTSGGCSSIPVAGGASVTRRTWWLTLS